MKVFFACLARIRFFSSVDLFMSLQMTWITETFITFLTRIRFFSIVDIFTSLQMTWITECGFSPMWILSCFFRLDFWPNVLKQYLHEKGFSSVLINTCVFKLPNWLKHLLHVLQEYGLIHGWSMSLQITFFIERFYAFPARIQVLSSVIPFLIFQIWFPIKLFASIITVLPLEIFRFQFKDQVTLIEENLDRYLKNKTTDSISYAVDSKFIKKFWGKLNF